MDIRLNFVNRSDDKNNSDIVIFEKNAAPGGELAVAWLVIRNCGPGGNYPFVYPTSITVAASDSYGDFTPQLPARNGQLFSMTFTPSGDTLVPSGAASSPTGVEISNALPQGAINAYLFRAGRLLAQKTSIAPGQKALFQLAPTLWIGVAPQVDEGQLISSPITTLAELSLLGIASADIVMTGGGGGQAAKPFLFTLQNIVMA